MIHSTMAAAFNVVRQASLTVSQLSRRWSAATMNEPKVPMPAASTGVATPVKMTPSTRATSSSGATISLSNCSFSTKLMRSSGGSAGPSDGFNSQRTEM